MGHDRLTVCRHIVTLGPSWALLRIAVWLLLEAGASALPAQATLDPPARPAGLRLTAKTASTISLKWQPAADPSQVAGYDVFCDDLRVGQSSTNSYICTGLVERTSYTFRVKARNAAGNVSDPSNALLATPRAGVDVVEPVEVRTQFRALVIVYDPYQEIDGQKVRASVHLGLRSVDALVQDYLQLMRLASGGQMVWSVTDTFELAEYPPAGPDCGAIIHDSRFGIVDRVNTGQLDALWIFGLPDSGFAEAAMAGPSPYWVNGAEIQDSSLTRNIILYGFGREGHQGVGFMCENTCHMTEIILRDHIAAGWPRSVSTRTFNTLNLENPDRRLLDGSINDWTHFTQAEAASWDPVLVAPGCSQAGLSHFPPTAMHNYNWNTVRYDFGNADAFRVFDGSWSVADGEYHVLAGEGVKSLAFDDMTLGDSLGDYHPAVAFSDGDIEVNVRIASGRPGAHAGFLFRVAEARPGLNQVRGYYVGLAPAGNRLFLAKLDRAFVSLAEAPFPILPGMSQRLRVEARQQQIRVFLNRSLRPMLSVTNDSYLTGAFGLTAYATDAWFSDLSIVAHTLNQADQWYAYPRKTGDTREISPLEWNGDQDVGMDHFYAWWWEHLPKNGGGHYAVDLVDGRRVLILNTWWPYVFDFNRFTRSSPFDDIVFPPEDLAPPTAPPSVGGIALDAGRVGLYWEEATDNIGVTRYAVYRNGSLLRKTASPSLIDTRLSPGTSYRYTVKACDGSGNESRTGPAIEVTTLPANGPVTIIDGGFELPPAVVGWTQQAWNSGAAKFTWEPVGTGRDSTRCGSIEATQDNDCRWVQQVRNLTPGATYWISGWVKGEGITPEPGKNVGANLCLDGTWTRSADGLIGTFDWRQVSLSFVAPLSGTVNVGCRLGYWSNTARGKAWFDDLWIVGTNDFRLAQPRMLANGDPQFLLLTSPGANCRVDLSTNLADWRPLRIIRTVHPVTEIQDTNPAPASTRFYRARK